MSTKTMLRVRQGSLLLDPKSGGVIAYAGELVELDHPAVLDHPSIGSDCYRVEVEVADVPATPSAPELEFDPVEVSED